MAEQTAQVILLVEDNHDHTFLISRAFAKSRDVMVLKIADSVSSANTLIESSSPAVILCDYLLPDGTGLEILQRQREGNPSAPPFVLLTSQGDENIAVAAMKAGATDYIVKSETSLMSLPDVCRAIMREHEQRREKTRAMENLQNLIREQSTVLNTSIVGITKVVNRVMVWVNRAMSDIFGYSISELENAGTRMLYPSDDAYIWSGKTAYPELAKGVSHSFEMQMRRKDGTLIWVLLHGNAIDPLRSAEGTVWIFEDITRRRQLEAQLRESQKMESIGRLAGGVAHDFNNILTVIIGYCNLLGINSKLDVFQKEAVEQIMASAEKAAQLTGGLLAFSRKQVIDPKQTNLNEIVQHVQKFLLRIIGEDVQLQLTINEAQLPVTVDIGQIEQVLINLATNARDAMKKSGLLSIETGLQEIDETRKNVSGLEDSGRYACISVTDTGSGMDEDTSSRVFEPFFTTKEVGKGTGLGMAIVHGIVKQHNGFITVHSELGVGTTFRIYLPVAKADTCDLPEKVVQAPPQGGSETILLAEDDIEVRKLVTSVLTHFGYEVIEAEDGQAAVEKFSANRERITLILMDVIMPRKNGQEAYEEISQLKPGVKVLYTSGYTADFIENHGVSEERINLVMKPILPLDLLRKVREMLDS